MFRQNCIDKGNTVKRSFYVLSVGTLSISIPYLYHVSLSVIRISNSHSITLMDLPVDINAARKQT